MTKRHILSTLRRSGAMYASELGGNHEKLWDMCDEGLILSSRCSDRRYLYTLTEAGRQWLDDKRTFWRGFWQGYTLPVTLAVKLWRRIFK